MLRTMRRTAAGRSGVPRTAWACDETSQILTSLTVRYQIVSAIAISHDHADVFLWMSEIRAAGGPAQNLPGMHSVRGWALLAAAVGPDLRGHETSREERGAKAFTAQG